jgi:membrane-bound lytic murein transglycosylase MltF
MLKRRVIRALVPFSRTFFFLDRGRKRGLTYDELMEYEKFLNRRAKNRSLNVHIVVIPTPRNRLFSDLVAGYGDIAAGNLTITPERKKLVDFSDPTMVNVREIIVSGPASPKVSSIFDLSGKEIVVRKSSSYYESLQTLNTTLASIGKKPIKVTIADEYLEDEDLLEMVNSGILPFIIIDSHKGEFWAKIFPRIRLHHELKLRTGGEIAWAIRKHSPRLKKSVNRFVRTIRKGTLTGNILFRRYLQNTGYIKNILSEKSRKRYEKTISLFKKYAGKYDFPYLLLTARAYQEAGLDQSKRSAAGAVGIMQILPSTARDKNVNIKNINRLENNIHAGTRYLRFMANRYFSDSKLTPLNRDLFTIASYNAGPGRVARLRKEAARRGLDPNVWFNNVEVVAAARIGRETVQYVRNIYKYYVAYDYIMKKEQLKKVGSAILRSHYEK